MEFMPTRKTPMHSWHEKIMQYLQMLELGRDHDIIKEVMKLY